MAGRLTVRRSRASTSGPPGRRRLSVVEERDDGSGFWPDEQIFEAGSPALTLPLVVVYMVLEPGLPCRASQPADERDIWGWHRSAGRHFSLSEHDAKFSHTQDTAFLTITMWLWCIALVLVCGFGRGEAVSLPCYKTGALPTTEIPNIALDDLDRLAQSCHRRTSNSWCVGSRCFGFIYAPLTFQAA